MEKLVYDVILPIPNQQVVDSGVLRPRRVKLDPEGCNVLGLVHQVVQPRREREEPVSGDEKLVDLKKNINIKLFLIRKHFLNS